MRPPAGRDGERGETGARWALAAAAVAAGAVALGLGAPADPTAAGALAPDGERVALDLLGSIWVMPADGGAARRITDEAGDARQPDWSPDGERIAFQSYRDGNWHVWTIAPDGSGLRQLTHGPYDHREPAWSPDGTRIALASDRGGSYDVWSLEVESGELSRLTSAQTEEYAPDWSPAGNLLAYVSRGDSATRGLWLARPGGAHRRALAVDGRLYGPSWSPDGGRVAFVRIADATSRLLAARLSGRSLPTGKGAAGRNPDPLLGGDAARPLTGEDEDVFPFRAAWTSAGELLYTADGVLKRRTLEEAETAAVRRATEEMRAVAAAGARADTVGFRARISFARDAYRRASRDFDASGPREVRGIYAPAVSPSGDRVAFAAAGDLWLLPVGERPRRLTRDPFVDLDPAWSPEGDRIAFASDRAGSLDLWVMDPATGEARRVTSLPGAETAPDWSPDGERLAFLAREGRLMTVPADGGEPRTLRGPMHMPGRPSWSGDGRWIALSVLRPYSDLYREGTNRILAVPVDGGQAREHAPIRHRSVGTRETDGPVWSPDGRKMAWIMGGSLWVQAVEPDGEPVGPPYRLTDEVADAPTWTGDSRSLVYLSGAELKRVQVSDGRTTTLPLELTWRREVAEGRLVVHAGRLWDGTGPDARRDVDVVIRGNRIQRVVPHRDDLHRGRVVDASGRTVMPGLIDSHTHQGSDLGEVLGRIWLAYGVTTVREPAANDYRSLERREAVGSGVRPGPRQFFTGNTFDGSRIYYSGALPLRGGAGLQQELERAVELDYDLIKTYVRLEDRLQRRVVEFAHEHGIPVTSHELYPAVAYGADGVEHVRGTSRRGYSPKVSELYRSYGDVVGLLAATDMTLTPTVGIYGGFPLALARDPGLLEDPRFRELFPPQVREGTAAALERGREEGKRLRALVPHMERTAARVVEGGGTVIAGTDSPIIPQGLSLHTELRNYVDGGMSPYQALRAATAAAAEALGEGDDIGTVEAGKLADLVVVDGNPLEEIRASVNVTTTVKGGRVYRVEELLRRLDVPEATEGRR